VYAPASPGREVKVIARSLSPDTEPAGRIEEQFLNANAVLESEEVGITQSGPVRMVSALDERLSDVSTVYVPVVITPVRDGLTR
jgi:hypothetical protein